MTWLDQIRARIFRPGESPEQADRRAFLLGATVTAAGLLVPKTIVSVAKAMPVPVADVFAAACRSKMWFVGPGTGISLGYALANAQPGRGDSIVVLCPSEGAEYASAGDIPARIS